MKMFELFESAIEDAVWALFEGEIPLEDPTETTKMFIKHVYCYMNENEEDDDEE